MKNFTKLFALVAVMFGFSLGASAQSNSATSTGVVANATIIAPITITLGTDLSFGDVVAGAGTVEVGFDGTRTATVGLIVAADEGTASSFTVGGETGYEYTIALPASIVLTDAVSSDVMTVNGFTAYIGSAIAATGTITGGTSVFTVGATLNVTAVQASGLYEGTYDVTVAYN